MTILYCYIQIYINKYLSIKAGSTGKNFIFQNNIISLISIWSIFNKKIDNSISNIRSLILLEKVIKKIGFVNEIKKYIIPKILDWILENIHSEDNLINLTLHYAAEMLYYWLKNINSQEINLFFKENSEKLLFIEPLFYKNKYYICKNEQKETENYLDYLEKCEILIRFLYFENDVSEWIFYELENTIKKIENEKIINLFKNINEENIDKKSIYLEIYKIIIKINYENEEILLKNLFEKCQILNFHNEIMIFLNNFLKENKEKKIIFILEFLYEILSNELIIENISKIKFLALKTIQILFEKEKKYVFYLLKPFFKYYEEISMNKLLKKGKINKSLLVLALESIWIWGNLYPDSFYGNFLNELIEKKVKFPENLNYFHKIQINISKSKYFEEKINCFMDEIYKIYNNNDLIIKFIDENKDFLTEINIFIKKGGDISLNSYRNLYIFREIILLDSNFFRKIQILLYSKPYIINFSSPIKVNEILLCNFYEKIIKKTGYFQKYSCYYENAIINDEDFEILDIIFVIFHRLCNENGYCREKNKILIMLKNIFLHRKLILMNKISLYIIPHLIKELLFFEKKEFLIDIFEAKDFFIIVSEFIIEIFQENQRFNFIDNDTIEKIKLIFKEKEIKLKINCLSFENKKFFYHKDSVFLNKKLLKQPSNLNNNTDFYKNFDDLWTNSRKMHISLKKFESIISKANNKIKMNDLYQEINLKSKEIFNFDIDKSHNILHNNFIEEILLNEKKVLPFKKLN